MTVEHNVLVARMERDFCGTDFLVGEAGEAQKAHALALVLYQAKQNNKGLTIYVLTISLLTS